MTPSVVSFPVCVLGEMKEAIDGVLDRVAFSPVYL